MMGEFEAIEAFFRFPNVSAWSHQGIGDDCAIVNTGSTVMALTMDQMAITTHFLENVNPYTCGQKALAVNLSDLAAAGATPRVFLLSLGLPATDPAWLKAFSQGLQDQAARFGCALIGGDTTRTPRLGHVHAPTTIAITAIGEIEGSAPALTRAGACVGDDVWVSAPTGRAYAALQTRLGHWEEPHGLAMTPYWAAMDTPEPRVQLGQQLRGLASACADVSDGLMQDVGHIAERSGVTVELDVMALPLDPLMPWGLERARQAALAGGDDYELVFTAPASTRARIQTIGQQCGCAPVRIGKIIAKGPQTVRLVQGNHPCELSLVGFDHFR